LKAPEPRRWPIHTTEIATGSPQKLKKKKKARKTQYLPQLTLSRNKSGKGSEEQEVDKKGRPKKLDEAIKERSVNVA